MVGAVARLLLPGNQHLNIAASLIIGVLGSVVGGVLANLLGTGDLLELNVVGAIVAILMAIALVLRADRVGIGRRS